MGTSNERITLRLEKENIEALDSFMSEHGEVRSRSELCRAALDRYLRQRGEETKVKGREIRIKLPAKYVESMEKLVDENMLTSVEYLINKLVEDYFTNETIKALEEKKMLLAKLSGTPVISLGDRDEIIPR